MYTDERLSLKWYRRQIKQDVCGFCNFHGLKQQPVQHYDHTGGWKVKGMAKLQWLYVICPCSQQWALNCLGVARDIDQTALSGKAKFGTVKLAVSGEDALTLRKLFIEGKLGVSEGLLTQLNVELERLGVQL